MKVVTDLPFRVRETPDIGIVLSDGCRLSARVWMPEDAKVAPVPAVLEYIPYRKRDGTTPRDEIMHPYVAGHGYACVRVDMRGSGDSEGLLLDEYSEQELADAVEVIAWLAAQPWCSGSVGMMGKSWGGFNCLQTAFLRPPALKAVISVCSRADRFGDDIHFKGGCLLGENVGWGAVMLSFSSRPPDPLLRSDWREAWLARLEADELLAVRWAGHQSRDAYWRHGSVAEDWPAIEAAVMTVGGWADNYMNTIMRLLENIEAPVQGLIGPWGHQYPHTAPPGPQIGFLQMAVRWWDRWLKGIANGAESDPALRAYVLHSELPDASPAARDGRWIAEAEWPAPEIVRRTLFLEPGGGLGETAGALLDVAIATPQHLGLQAGEFFPMGLNAELPGDQREDDALSVCFETGPFEAPLEIFGAARARLRIESDRPQAFVVARLCDVAPDGSSVRIAHGMLNLCHRESFERPSAVPVGESLDVAVPLDQAGYRLAAGHRLRLALSNSYWPFVWPSPSPAVLRLRSGALNLPVREGEGEGWTPPSPEGAPEWRYRVVRPAAAARRIERDLISGRIALVVEEDGGEAESLDHGLATGSRLIERWSILPDDPTSARIEIDFEQTLSRDDWRVRTEARVSMWSDPEALHFEWSLVAYEGDERIFARNDADSVERRFI